MDTGRESSRALLLQGKNDRSALKPGKILIVSLIYRIMVRIETLYQLMHCGTVHREHPVAGRRSIESAMLPLGRRCEAGRRPTCSWPTECARIETRPGERARGTPSTGDGQVIAAWGFGVLLWNINESQAVLLRRFGFSPEIACPASIEEAWHPDSLSPREPRSEEEAFLCQVSTVAILRWVATYETWAAGHLGARNGIRVMGEDAAGCLSRFADEIEAALPGAARKGDLRRAAGSVRLAATFSGEGLHETRTD